MILVDPRSGSQDYIAPLRALGAHVEVVTLEFGDVAFYGSKRVVGIELKKLGDMMNCITTGRFSGHQLPGLVEHYQDAYLIVEGLWRPNPEDGTLETWSRGGWCPMRLGKRTWMYRDLDSFLTTIEVKGGVRVKRTGGEAETTRAIYGLYQWWRDFDGHKSHLALNRTAVSAFVRPTFARTVAAALPGVGYEKSAAIALEFPTVRAMVKAKEKDWMEIAGIGKKLAKGIVDVWDSTA